MAMFDDLNKVLSGANINTKDLEKMAKGAGFDAKKGEDLLKMLQGGKADQKALSGIDPNAMNEVMKLLRTVDLSKVDVNGLAKQFGIPADAVKQIMSMIKK